MKKLERDDLYSLEHYAVERAQFRSSVLDHKKNRKLLIGAHASLQFEDRLTIQYQIQEMLRAERIFEPAGIQDELDAYNPLIPDGSNLKATFMIEYEDPAERQYALAQLVGIANKVWLQVQGFSKVYAIADEDLDREREDKTSAVHFLRFDFEPTMIAALKSGKDIAVGIEHPNYNETVDPLPNAIRVTLINDFE